MLLFKKLIIFILLLQVSIIGKDSFDIHNEVINNPTAYIPSQCYTITKDLKGDLHNPCYSCHQKSQEPNYINDFDLQENYSFPLQARENPYKNLFKDRTKKIAKISNKSILDYIRQGNYFDKNNEIILKKRLQNISKNWDYDNNNKWDGYIPDCYFNFDNEGFDKDLKNNYTGWRAFAYYPFLGTFWPTNGSSDDVLIRLDTLFMEDKNGKFNLEIYKINLAIVEALIKREDISIDEIDENLYGVDLDKNGILDKSDIVKYKWEPLKGINMFYVGMAKEYQEKNKVFARAGLYPKNTEFLHTVRYLDIKNNSIGLSKRLKELRYAKKVYAPNYMDLSTTTIQANIEKEDDGDIHEVFKIDPEIGISNGKGWRYLGFLEDKNGDLRPSTKEELIYCIGCHNNLGVTTDTTFVFQRKLGSEEFQKGWYHWKQKSLQGLSEPKRADGKYEYSYYLKNNHAGDEFRENKEIMEKFFNENGDLKQNEIEKLHKDITHLLIPSLKRAINLNKAYKLIVEEQSFIYGRDATIKPSKNIHKKLKENQTTYLKAIN